GLLLAVLVRLLVVPQIAIDESADLRLHQGPKLIGIHRVQFPTLVAVVLFEPFISGIAGLGFDGERWQRPGLLGRQRNAPEPNVVALIFLDDRRCGSRSASRSAPAVR